MTTGEAMDDPVIREKVNTLARLVARRSPSKQELNAIVRAVAKETGFTAGQVRGVLKTALLVAGKAQVLP